MSDHRDELRSLERDARELGEAEVVAQQKYDARAELEAMEAAGGGLVARKQRQIIEGTIGPKE